MTVHLHKHKITYVSVPKCACSSLKHYFFEIENGFKFRNFRASGTPKTIHNTAYRSIAFENLPHDNVNNHWRIAVIRDPVARVVSCFANRVLQYKELDKIDIAPADADAGVVTSPDLATFVRFLPSYRRLSRQIKHHTETLSHFLGKDAGYFAKIYRIDQLDDLQSDVSARVDDDLPELPWRHASKVKLSTDDLTQKDKDHIQNLFSDDYEVFGKFLAA